MKTESKIKKLALKNFFLVVFAFAFIATGYMAYDQYAKNTRTQKMVQLEKSKMEQKFFDSYAQIEKNLAEIHAHEGVINNNLSGQFAEGPLSPEERVQQEIDIIAALINDNNRLIEELTAQVDDQNSQLAMYSGKVHDLNKRVKQYEIKLAEFKEANQQLTANLDLAKKDNEVLKNDVAEKTNRIEQQSAELENQGQLISTQASSLAQNDVALNTAYYVVGSYQDLKEADVLEKEGGIVGIGGTKALKDDFNKNQFVRIDKRNYTMIPVYSKKAELLTAHASSSYEWVTDEQGVEWLKIKDTDKFWENNKYLVVVTKTGIADHIAKIDY